MNKNIFLILAIIVCLCGCDDFLETTPQDKVTEENFWQSESDALKFLTDIYSGTLRTDGSGSITYDEAMSDNAHMVWDWYGGQQQVANGTLTSYSDVPSNIWKQSYQNIRKCYQFLENIERVPELSSELKDRMIGEVHFLLAFNYNQLVLYFAEVPLVKTILTVEESKKLVQAPKTEVVDFIISQLDLASGLLNDKKMDWGRVTWGACQAFKARVLLFQGDWSGALTVTDGLMGKYTLNTAGDTPYEDLFSGMAENSDEIILSIPREKTIGSIKTGQIANRTFLLKGISGGDAFRAVMPTGSLVDSYPMADGRLIHENGSSYNPKDPYKDRDPRFYQSIVYPTGQIRYLNSATNTIESTLYDPEDPSTIAVQQYNASEPSATGYMWNKYVDWSPYAMNDILDCTNDLIVLRYAEVLLIRAEALAELNGVGSKGDVCNLLDQLRERCGAGLIHRENYNSKEAIIDLVRNERRVELAGEGLRYFDLLRGRIAEKTTTMYMYGLKGDLYGAYMRLDGVGKDDRTVLVDGVPRRYVETRFFDPAKQYINPIPQAEIDLNPNLNQNPNW